ncbi:MAG TPA: RNA polymerase sigma factor [Bryobacteraceae bacterium]|nr:RNA polymerase sigma factor [Bryobacteraceae bacterium]
MSDRRTALDRFGDTLLACQASLYRYARSLTRDPMSAEELVQETFRRALGARQKPVPPTEENTRAWLFTILRHHWLNELRRNKNSRAFDLHEIPLYTEPLDAQLSRKLLQSEIRTAIDMLPEPYREVVVLRDIEGMSYDEIARLLACRPGTVMSRLSRARDLLRRALLVSHAKESTEVER